MKDSSPTSGRGGADIGDYRVAIVVSTYHRSITDALTSGARRAISEVGLSDSRVHLVEVPGAFELPLAARRVAETGRFDAVVSLGCIIRGETPHFEYIASAVAHGITMASQATGVPIGFGVLTTDTLAQAEARAGAGVDNKGYEASLAAIGLARAIRGLTG